MQLPPLHPLQPALMEKYSTHVELHVQGHVTTTNRSSCRVLVSVSLVASAQREW